MLHLKPYAYRCLFYLRGEKNPNPQERDRQDAQKPVFDLVPAMSVCKTLLGELRETKLFKFPHRNYSSDIAQKMTNHKPTFPGQESTYLTGKSKTPKDSWLSGKCRPSSGTLGLKLYYKYCIKKEMK